MMTDPIELEVWRHLLAAVTEEMGAVLTRGAFSPNIKERRDLSCALFAPSMEMAAHAAHIPVHLGSTPMALRAVVEKIELGPGDVALVNDPYDGGTHLPDITLVAPVFLRDEPSRPRALGDGSDALTTRSSNEAERSSAESEAEPRLLGYVVNRAHHSDVGGSAAGSMPLARHIDEEGVRIPPTLVARGGEILREVLYEKLYRHVRTPMEREGDLHAQLAACRAGERRLAELARTYGASTLGAAMEGMVSHSERMMRALLRSLPDGRYEAEDFLDDDGLGNEMIPIRVAITIDGEEATIDFSGSAPMVEGPLNAVRAVTVSACLYALRCIAPEDAPASTGLLAPVRIITPEGTIVNARYPAPVAGGNVETSQRMVDVLFQALASALPERIPACSQGTMNNIALGGTTPAPWAYYETLGGGTGAGPGFHGESGIHSHMTNTLNTPVEAIEHSCPLMVRSMRLIRGSGGDGRWRGGDGIERSFVFLEPAEATLLCERRRRGPPGLMGGLSGRPGENLFVRRGEAIVLPGKKTIELHEDDEIVVRTPGGGGFGPPRSPPPFFE